MRARSVSGPGDADRLIGHKIRLRRMLVGMSQTALGQRVGVTCQQIQKYEKGVGRISSGRLQEIAAALGARVEELYDRESAAHRGGAPSDGQDEQADYVAMADFASDGEARRLVRVWMRLTPEFRSQLAASAEAAARPPDPAGDRTEAVRPRRSDIRYFPNGKTTPPNQA